jgi:hypothetical protein
MKLRSGILIGALGIALAALLANDAATLGGAGPGRSVTAAGVPHAAWREVDWPFRIDEWGIGRAYRCAPADCGTQIDLYLRAKVGFCNCATGVSDNADLDRVSDLDLFSEEFVGLTDGRPVSVGRLKGRSRLYRVDIPYSGARDMWEIGFNDQCDVAVATVLADPARLSEAEGLALEFLSSDPVQRWAAVELGGNGI